jgi:hypothetical protein
MSETRLYGEEEYYLTAIQLSRDYLQLHGLGLQNRSYLVQRDASLGD